MEIKKGDSFELFDRKLNGKVLSVSEKAILVRNNIGKPKWIPKSIIEEKMKDQGTIVYQLPTWFIDKWEDDPDA